MGVIDVAAAAFRLLIGIALLFAALSAFNASDRLSPPVAMIVGMLLLMTALFIQATSLYTISGAIWQYTLGR